MGTIRLTLAQALTRFLAAQRTEIDGQALPLFAGVWAIFGHGNVAAMGEALHGARDQLPTFRAHNEQGMAHAAVAFAKASRCVHFPSRRSVVSAKVSQARLPSAEAVRAPPSALSALASA